MNTYLFSHPIRWMGIFCTLCVVLTANIALAQIPPGYYDNAQGLSGDPLKAALQDIVSNGHVPLSYSGVVNALRETDENPNNSNEVILFYKGTAQGKNTFGGGANDWNREHVWAKSHGGFGNSPPAGTDLHHLRPTDASVNSSRGNKDFDNGGSPHSEAVLCNFDGDSWEPRPGVKGEVARALFYMAMRYDGTGGVADLELNDVTGNGSVPFHGKLSTMMAWHLEDTVTQAERLRNDIVYQEQGNRNPFVDHPEWVQSIWGTLPSVDFASLSDTVDCSNSTTGPCNIAFEYEINLSNDQLLSHGVIYGPSFISLSENILGDTPAGAFFTASEPLSVSLQNEVYWKVYTTSDELGYQESPLYQSVFINSIGLSESTLEALSVYEQQGMLYAKEEVVVEVFSLLGQRVNSYLLTPSGVPHSLRSGLYFVRSQKNPQEYSQRLLVK